jgi:hypothetical protein
MKGVSHKASPRATLDTTVARDGGHIINRERLNWRKIAITLTDFEVTTGSARRTRVPSSRLLRRRFHGRKAFLAIKSQLWDDDAQVQFQPLSHDATMAKFVRVLPARQDRALCHGVELAHHICGIEMVEYAGLIRRAIFFVVFDLQHRPGGMECRVAESGVARGHIQTDADRVRVFTLVLKLEVNMKTPTLRSRRRGTVSENPDPPCFGRRQSLPMHPFEWDASSGMTDLLGASNANFGFPEGKTL